MIVEERVAGEFRAEGGLGAVTRMHDRLGRVAVVGLEPELCVLELRQIVNVILRELHGTQ